MESITIEEFLYVERAQPKSTQGSNILYNIGEERNKRKKIKRNKVECSQTFCARQKKSSSSVVIVNRIFYINTIFIQ